MIGRAPYALAVLLVAVLAAAPSLPAKAQTHHHHPRGAIPSVTGGSIVVPGVVDNIPHLAEIGWDTDAPFLLAIRFEPEKLSFWPAWDQAAKTEMFHEMGLMRSSQPYPWPHFYVEGAGRTVRGLSALTPDDMAKVQDWSMKRATTLPPVFVHSVPVVRLPGKTDLTVRPLGIPADKEPDDQHADTVGFMTTIRLRVDKPANDYVVTVPPDVVARLPSSGLRLETRVRWHDPKRVEEGLVFATQPISLRLVAGDKVPWEHDY